MSPQTKEEEVILLTVDFVNPYTVGTAYYDRG